MAAFHPYSKAMQLRHNGPAAAQHHRHRPQPNRHSSFVVGGKRNAAKRLTPLEETINRDLFPVRLCHKRMLRVIPNKEFSRFIIQYEPSLPQACAIIAGKERSRTFPHGNRSSEVLVRINLQRFVDEILRVVFEGLNANRFDFRSITRKNIEEMCLDRDNGIRPDGFFTLSGERLGIHTRAFIYAVRQVLADMDFTKRLWRAAYGEYKKKKQ